MNWYYVEAGQQAGPVDDSQLAALAQNGKILADTLVWHEGMAKWQPYREVQPTGPGTSDAPPVLGMPPTGRAGGEAVCAECGNIFAVDNMIRFGAAHVCASCKPIFVQKMSEGARIGSVPMRYGGFWIRFVAKFIDNIITSLVGVPLGMLVGLTARDNSPVTLIIIQAISSIIGLLIGAAYNGWFVGKFGATPGKMIFRLKVVVANGSPVSYGRAIGRYFAEILSSLICLIGYIMAGFDDEKRALHDRICNTRVIYHQ